MCLPRILTHHITLSLLWSEHNEKKNRLLNPILYTLFVF
jgi:hypothetical protein